MSNIKYNKSVKIYYLHPHLHIILQLLQSQMQENAEEEPNFFAFLDTAPEQLNEYLESNLSLRMKFPTETEKFYSSQQNINEILATFESKLEEVEEPPEAIIKMLIDSKILLPLLKTLQHPNLDINISAVNCFFSLTVEMGDEIEQAEKNQKYDSNNEDQQDPEKKAFAMYFRMSIWLIENDLVQNLFRVMNKIDEQKLEEYEGFRKVLKILECLMELSNTVHPILIRDTVVISFFANRILPNFTVSHRVIDDNKFIVSDLLVSLLQAPQVQPGLSAVRQFYKCYGIEVIVETLSSYENKLPTVTDQRQYLMNLFDCLNIMLVGVQETRKQFHGMKGCYLMVSYICGKSEYGTAALKAISNSLDNEESEEVLAQTCDEIVNDGSLKYIFPILMRQGLKSGDDEEQGEINEHILRVIYFLLRNSVGVSRDRVINKFTESRFAKLQRVFELLVENQAEQVAKMAQIPPQEYIRLVKDQGFGSAELSAKIIATVWASSTKIKQRIKALLPLYNIKTESLRNILEIHYKYIDDGQEKEYLAKLLATNLRQIEQNTKI